MKITPINDRILVKPLHPDKVSRGGIILPDSAAEPATKGVVIACGPGLRNSGERYGMPFAVGDLILYGQYAGKDVELNGEQFKVLREDDVLLKLEE